MVTVKRDGKVFAEVGEVDVNLGEVEKLEDGWEGHCALCEEPVMDRTKSGVVDRLEDHFISDHTTPSI